MSDNRTRVPHRGGATDPLDRVSTPQAIVNRIATEILDGDLKPGEELREVELAERLGVSRPSLREAITQLSYRGLVERRPHRSVRVTALSKTDARDIMRTRGLIEAEAVRRIAVDPTKWPVVEEALKRVGGVSDSAGWSHIAESDIAFHRALVSAAGSPRLSRAHDQLVDEMLLLLAPGRHFFKRSDAVLHHQELVDAMRTGDPDVAAERVLTHLEHGTNSIVEYLPDDVANAIE